MSGFVKVVLLFLLSSIPLIASAQGVFDVPATDKSMQYLGMVFGTVGSLPIQSSGNPLFSQLMYIFNQIVFALAIIIIIFTSIMATINTAQEGEMMGKKMSSIWIPARAGIGMFLLLPSATGYNWIQITVMWLIVQGVGAANALWNQVIYANQFGGNTVADTRKVDLQNAIGTVSSIFNCVLCMQQLNKLMLSDPNVADQIKEPISVYRFGDKIEFGRSSKQGQEAPLCGSINVPAISSGPLSTASDANVEQRKKIMADAIMLAQNELQFSAAEAIQNPAGPWDFANNWVSAARALQGATLALQTTFASLNDVNQQAIFDGWIHAGSYYFQLVSNGAYTEVKVNIGATTMNSDALNKTMGPTNGSQFLSGVNTLASSYLHYVQTDPQLASLAPSKRSGGTLAVVDMSSTSSNSALGFSDFGLGGQAGTLFDTIFGKTFFSSLADKIQNEITGGCLSSSSDPRQQKNDPVICMASFGAEMAGITETLFFASVVAVFIAWLASSPMSCVQPLGHAMNFVLAIAVPIVGLMIMLVWAAGITLALYVPLIPFLVFTFSALGWIVLVIEAMLGAPCIALTLIIPSEDEIGKATHAIIILLGLFLRPALMILGFILGMQLLIVAVGMLNFGFSSTLTMSLSSGVGPFGLISIIMIYAGIAVGLVHESFSLIYLLPDKVLRWMGAHGEGSEAGAHAKELEGSVGKGSSIGTGAMKGGIGYAQSKIR